MKIKYIHHFPLLLTFIVSLNVFAQPNLPPNGQVFRDDLVPRIDIYIHPDTLIWIYNNTDSDIEFHAVFAFNNGKVKDTVYNVGFRLRGNTSRNAAKKSFKISFNTYEKGKKWQGIEKLNLNSEHNDPSLMRAKICWDLMRKLNIPAPRANHIALYINNIYYGLYLNVEHIDEEFAQLRFGNKNGNLYKCLYPADLKFISNNPKDYKFSSNGRRAYDNMSSEDYSDLSDFIALLNQTPLNELNCKLQKVFNLQEYLKIMVLDVFCGNWDGYIFNKNNFYLYHNTKDNRFEYIPYDLDNTFGIDWFSIDWANRNIYNWSHPNEFRPLYQRLLMVPEIKNQYSALMKDFISKLDTNMFFQQIDAIKSMIRPYVFTDNFYKHDYGYSITDFDNSFEKAAGKHVKNGIKNYIRQRMQSINQTILLNDIKPLLNYISNNYPGIHDSFKVRVFVWQNVTFQVNLKIDFNNSGYISYLMYDDGNHDDMYANDGYFSISLPPFKVEGKLKYLIEVKDKKGASTHFPCSEVSFDLKLPVKPKLFINEFMADNSTVISDEAGEFDDWIEIYNAGDNSVWLGDKYLSDNLKHPDKWKLPEYYIMPGEFLLIWADDDENQGRFHTNFKLEKNGEEIGLFNSASSGFAIIDSVIFKKQSPNTSSGRKTDGDLVWINFEKPSPGRSNSSVSVSDLLTYNELILFPNPVINGNLFLSEKANFEILDNLGRIVKQSLMSDFADVSTLPKGFYILKTDKGQHIKFLLK